MRPEQKSTSSPRVALGLTVIALVLAAGDRHAARAQDRPDSAGPAAWPSPPPAVGQPTFRPHPPVLPAGHSLPSESRDVPLVALQEPEAAPEPAEQPESEPESSEAGDSEDDDSEDTLEERLTKLETVLEEQLADEEANESARPTAPTFEIGGRIHLDHWAFPETTPGIDFFEYPDTGIDPESRFAFRRIRLEMEGEVLETMFWRMQIDFNEPQNPEYKDVYIGFDDLPIVQTLVIGNQKRPLGLDHLNSSRFNVFMERPLVVEAFNEDARRLGICAYGVSEDEVFNWQYGVFNLENTAETGRYIGDSLQMSLNGRLASSPWYDEVSGGRGYLHLAVATMLAHPDGDVDPRDSNENEARFRTRPEARSDNRWIDTGRIRFANWYNINGLEAILNIGAFQVVSELQTNRVSRTTGDDLFFHGAYVYVAYVLTGEHVPYDRETGTIDRLVPFENFFLVNRCSGKVGGGWGAWQVAARYSYLDLTDDDIRGGVEDNLTLGLNWYWTAYSKLQFNAIAGEIRDHEPVAGFTGGHFTALGTRVMVDF